MNVTRISPLLMVILLSACATVEEQKPVPSAAPAGAPSPASAPQSRPAPQAVPSAAKAPLAKAAAKIAAPQKRSVYFDYDRSEIKPEFRAVIEENAKYLREHPALRVRIEGNCDERGSREYNVALGQRRAEAVMKMMALLGVRPDRMEAVSYGEEKPRVLGHDEASWAENRRGDVMLEIK